MQRFPQNDIISLTGTLPRYNLAESYGPNIVLGDILDEESWRDLRSIELGYGTIAGNPELRSEIARPRNLSANDVIVTSGAVHALFLVAFALCREGDEVVVARPVFPPARDVLSALDAEIRDIDISFDEGYRVNASAIAAQLTPRTRLVSLASPQNPSGVSVPEETLSAIAAAMATICPEAVLLVDETYREATYGGAAPQRSASWLAGRVLTCASLSKCHGAPGLRIGWLGVADAHLRKQLVLTKFNTVISVSEIDQLLALRLLRRSAETLPERAAHLAECVAIVGAWAEANRRWVEWVKPTAGALCCVRLKRSAFDDEAVERFYERLPDLDVVVARGHWFEEEPRVFRLGFGYLPAEELRVALGKLTEALRQDRRP
jgi:aspartate/methionine/tyrosine aminotransferase